jgi:hypothetical protein
MSTAKYSSGQKTVERANAGAEYAEPEKGSCACSVRVAADRPTRLRNQELRPLDPFIVSLLPAPAAAFVVSQVLRG